MKIALLGGDLRFAYLRNLLVEDGHLAAPLCLEKALPEKPPETERALREADAAVLPLPAERNGELNAPYSAGKISLDSLLPQLPAGTPVLAGMAGEALAEKCRRLGLPLMDYGRRETFQLQNAALTAEAALPLLMEGPKALIDSSILICGYGRIGKELARRLTGLGAAVTVAARSEASRLQARQKGCRVLPLEKSAHAGYDAVVNTVPARIFDRAAILSFGGARLLELASSPYGFDAAAAEAIGNPVLLASGLPGKCLPASAAKAIKASIYACLKERERNEA